jgi:membrane-bound metal-dependent hydrolase YbcI (DUF457 family)
MMWRTHLMCGLASLWVLEPFASISSNSYALWMGGAMLGSLLPDLDASESKIRHLGWRHNGVAVEPLQPLAWLAHRAFGHRGFLHSLGGLGLCALALAPAAKYLGGAFYGGALLGYASHLLADGLTKSGVPLWQVRPFTPHRSSRRVHLLPRQLRISTGSMAEEVVFVLVAMTVLLMLMRHLTLPP